MAALAALRVDGPPPGPPPPFGLVTTPGTIIDPGDPHFTAGVVVEPYPPGTPGTHNPCSTGTARVKAAAPANITPPEFSSFTVYMTAACDGMNDAQADWFKNRLRLAFQAREGMGVEHEFCFASADSSRPHLTALPFTDLSGGTPVGPKEALSLLENAIGATGELGFVHVDPGTFVAMDGWGLFHDEGATKKTNRGNTVIIGDGYIGAKPDSNPALSADESYAFATGPVLLARDDVVVIGTTSQSLDRSTNTITFRAERNYVAYWDTELRVGCNVDRSTTP